MPRIDMQLEEQLSDARSNEVAYRLRVENLGGTAVDLLSVTPRIPEGVQLLEVKDSSAQAAKLRHEAVCEELSELLGDHLYTSSKDVQQKALEISKAQFAEIISDMTAIWRPYLKLMSGVALRNQEKYRMQRAAVGFQITGKADAEIALQKWFGDSSLGPHLNISFERSASSWNVWKAKWVPMHQERQSP